MKTPLLVFVIAIFLLAATIDLSELYNYQNQEQPDYITKDNTATNAITDMGATLGRVLFYDVNLSATNTTSCASCHQQEFAFSDPLDVSPGHDGGFTGRHAMRLINAKFGDEDHFFWDERATTLEAQTTAPIQDHTEMGFSGTDGDPDFDDLINKLEALDYYQTLFEAAFGDATITEERMQFAMAQFIRSIQSFDSKFDAGRERVNNDRMPFPNFTDQENLGKQLFMTAPNNGGAGCNGCHRAPEFDIDPNSRNNGVIGVFGDPTSIDLTVTRSPSLRDVFSPEGELNGPLMHDASFQTMRAVLEHYNEINVDPRNNNLDRRLRNVEGLGQNLNLTNDEMDAIEDFLKTLSGSNVYTDPKYSNPFGPDGDIDIIPVSITTYQNLEFDLYPNLASTEIQIQLEQGNYQLQVYNQTSQLVYTSNIKGSTLLDISNLPKGLLIISITNQDHKQIGSAKLIHL